MNVSLTRPVAPDPYSLLPPVPSFALRSDDVKDGERLPDRHTAIDAPAGEPRNVSPHLEWSGFPEATRGFLVSCFDPDAPGPSGWWHWTVVDVPVTTTSLPAGAGSPDGSGLPDGAFHLRGDDGVPGYMGPLPPVGDQVHRYFFVVHALDVPTLGIGSDTAIGAASTMVLFHTLARAILVGTYQR